MPGRGGLVRIKAAFWNTVGGIKEGLATEAAIKQEVAIACIAFPLSFFIASDLWTWVALIASLLLVLSIEFLSPPTQAGAKRGGGSEFRCCSPSGCS